MNTSRNIQRLLFLFFVNNGTLVSRMLPGVSVASKLCTCHAPSFSCGLQALWILLSNTVASAFRCRHCALTLWLLRPQSKSGAILFIASFVDFLVQNLASALRFLHCSLRPQRCCTPVPSEPHSRSLVLQTKRTCDVQDHHESPPLPPRRP